MKKTFKLIILFAGLIIMLVSFCVGASIEVIYPLKRIMVLFIGLGELMVLSYIISFFYAKKQF